MASLPAIRRPRRRTIVKALIVPLAVYGLCWLLGTLSLLGVSALARWTTDGARPPVAAPGIDNLERVDGRVWRGAAPSADGYRWLARLDVRTVVDLRAEDLSASESRLPERLGLRVVRVPIRDGQAPGPADVRRFLDAVNTSSGPVFVHCGAGVGRTGTMAAAYLVATGQAEAGTAMSRSLAVGPPTLEQFAFMRGLRDGTLGKPPTAVAAASRVLDAPRRIWSRLGR